MKLPSLGTRLYWWMADIGLNNRLVLSGIIKVLRRNMVSLSHNELMFVTVTEPFDLPLVRLLMDRISYYGHFSSRSFTEYKIPQLYFKSVIFTVDSIPEWDWKVWDFQLREWRAKDMLVLHLNRGSSKHHKYHASQLNTFATMVPIL